MRVAAALRWAVSLALVSALAIALALATFVAAADAQGSGCDSAETSAEECLEPVSDAEMPSSNRDSPGPDTIANRPAESRAPFGFGINPELTVAPEVVAEVAAPTLTEPEPTAPLAQSGSESHGLIIIGMGLVSAGSAVVGIVRRFGINR